MKPMELTTDIVRNELKDLVRRYPDNTGSTLVKSWWDGDGGEKEIEPISFCVYYTDKNGYPVDCHYQDNIKNDEEAESKFVNPICIIGRWVQDFHPEYKKDYSIRGILIKNGAIRNSHLDDIFTEPVAKLLGHVQESQDGDSHTTWKDIEF